MDPAQIRNFCIIAHIDHGKSTLADRLLEITKTVEKRRMRAQVLDQMDIERERGITVKLAPVRMQWRGYELNLIDTPGHVDFSYEVSRSLAAVEGAVLLVDATQGIQAQTLANLDLAKQQGLTIVPVVNKIDLPNADANKVIQEMAHLLKIDPARVIKASGKTGLGVEEILSRIIETVPSPTVATSDHPRALIFDSLYDGYQGVVVYVRLMDGNIKTGQKIRLMGTNIPTTALEVGTFHPERRAATELTVGEIGYITTGLKNVRQARVGDTVGADVPGGQALPGYRPLKPMVYAGIFTASGEEAAELRDALEKLQLNDAALQIEPEQSPALGYGFRCGFLGLLHLDIVRERLQREYSLDIIVTVPSVAYRVLRHGQTEPDIVRSPMHLPNPGTITSIEEPYMHLQVVTPSSYIGGIMTATQERRGQFLNLEYLDPERAVVHFEIPLSSILVDYYDTLKSVSAGYASVNYDFAEYRPADVVRMDILVAGEIVEPLATIVYRDAAQRIGRVVTEKLKNVLPRQMFEVKIQAAVGSDILASERIPPLRKDVTAKLYGGDVTRKRKLLEKQKKGKRRMKTMGKVDVPPDAYLSLLTR